MKLSETILSDPRNRKRYYFTETPARRVMIALARGLLRLFAAWKVEGLENLPAEGPVVLAANHLTNFDPFLVQFALPRPVFFMGKAELFANPLIEPLLRQLGGFPVYRGAQDEWAMRHAQTVLERGQVLGIFPEGSRSAGKGLKPGKTGAARLALAVKCPILPLALDGTQRIFQRFPRRGKVSLTIGTPILASPEDTALSLTDRLMFAIADLLPVTLRGVYAERPAGFA